MGNENWCRFYWTWISILFNQISWNFLWIQFLYFIFESIQYWHLAVSNTRYTPNRDQLRTDLQVEKFWISWTREQSLNCYRQIASYRLHRFQGATGIRVNENCIISQVIRVTCGCITTDLRARDPGTPFVSLSAKTRAPELWPRPDAVIHLRSTSDSHVMPCDRIATDLRPGRDRLEWPVLLGKDLHEIKISSVTCDRFTTVMNHIRGNRVNHDQPTKTCDQRRIQLRVGSLASAIDKFQDRFWRLKAIVELVDVNGQ